MSTTNHVVTRKIIDVADVRAHVLLGCRVMAARVHPGEESLRWTETDRHAGSVGQGHHPDEGQMIATTTKRQGGESGKWTDGAGMTINNGIGQRLDGGGIECVRSADWCFMEPLYSRTAPYFNSIGAPHLFKGGDRQRSLSDGVRGNVNSNVTTAISWPPTAIFWVDSEPPIVCSREAVTTRRSNATPGRTVIRTV